MRILVTGGAGFIGANLCQRLLEEGNEVVAVDNFITGSRRNVRGLRVFPKFTFIKHDITKPFSSNYKLRTTNYERIFHLACPTGVDNLVPLAEEMLLTCTVGTRNVLELARLTGAKVLFTSSSEVYGDPEVSPQKENYTGNVDPVGVRSPYEEGKRLAESLALMYVRKHNVDTKIVRVFNTYGLGMSTKDSRVIPALLFRALNNQPLTIYGDGLQRRTFCYIDDLVKGLLQVIEKGNNGQVYNIGNNTEISILDLAEVILKITGSRSRFQFLPRPSHDHQRRLPSLEKIQRLGWYPETDLHDGLKKTLESLDPNVYAFSEKSVNSVNKWLRLPRLTFIQNLVRS